MLSLLISLSLLLSVRY